MKPCVLYFISKQHLSPCVCGLSEGKDNERAGELFGVDGLVVFEYYCKSLWDE